MYNKWLDAYLIQELAQAIITHICSNLRNKSSNCIKQIANICLFRFCCYSIFL